LMSYVIEEAETACSPAQRVEALSTRMTIAGMYFIIFQSSPEALRA